MGSGRLLAREAEDHPEWGTEQAFIRTYVYAPNNVAEIDVIRALR